MRAQYLDSMDIERERGITIKAQNVRVGWTPTAGTGKGKHHTIHLIDTPGHVDFGYEVSRSLAACEGVVLVVDAAQGIEAQTLANCYLALEHDLAIVACLNKIDLPSAEPEKYAAEIETVLGIPAHSILRISAKTGMGIGALLDAVCEQIPAPGGDPAAPLQGLMFDSYYDEYRGVVSAVRIMNGRLRTNAKVFYMHARGQHEVLEVGVRTPTNSAVDELGPGEVGYLICGIKNLAEARSGETVTDFAKQATEMLPGYKQPKPMVFCGLYPIDGDDFPALRDALDKLKLSDASITYEPETSEALGFGFRCGYLGLLHMEIARERLEREFNLALIATAPSVEYQVTTTTGELIYVDNPSQMPPVNHIESISEPYFKVSILTPADYTGTIMELCQNRRGEMVRMDYLSPERLEMVYRIPLAEVVVDFFDALKSRTKGYASLDYELDGYGESQLVKLDVLLNGLPVDAFSTIIHRSKAEDFGRKMTAKLRELIPRQMFDVPIQAAIGARVVARETVKAKRKDVLAKCYGGDISRKRKLLEKQKEGKKKMKSIGRVEVPQEAFISALKLEE
jgi:GTP-binding protein LepA